MTLRVRTALVSFVLGLSCTSPKPPPLASAPAASNAPDAGVPAATAPAAAHGNAGAPSAATSSPSAATGPRVSPRRLAGGGPRSVSGTKGVVTSAEENATKAGIDVLEAGGNAVDAAVAVAATLAVTHPNAGNLGGGGFALVRQRGGPTVAYDFRESAPYSLTRPDFDAMIRGGGQGPGSVGVPGSPAGLLLLHADFGK